jgi:PAS domain S-box-containing protein
LENNGSPGREHGFGLEAGMTGGHEGSQPLHGDITTGPDVRADVRRLFEDISLGILAIDANDNTLFLNGKMAQSLSYTVDEVAGKNFFELTYDRHEDAKRFWKRVREGESLRQELTLRCKDGTPCYTIVSAIAVHDPQGCYMHTLGMFTDITDHKQREDAIRNSQERYRILIEDTNDLIWEVNKDYVYTYLSPRIYDMLGYTVEEAIGRKIFDNMPPDEVGYAKQLFSMLETKEVPAFKVESAYLHKDGHIVYLETSGRSIKDKKGIFVGCRGTARDVTKRRMVEEALIKSEEKYRLLTENIDDLIWETGKNGHFIYMSPRSNEVIGRAPEDALGKTPFELMEPESARKAAAIVMAAKIEKKPFADVEAVYLHGQDGHPIYMEISGRPVIDTKGDLVGYRGVSRDVTQRKIAEMALEASKSEAELYVDLMGHDINNMNQITMGFLELAQTKIESGEKLGPEDIGLLEKAMASLSNSSRLIDNVRKLQREKMGLYRPEVLDVVRLVKEVVPQYKQIPGRNVRINVATTDHCYVEANELLKDVLINLIGNSIKHSRGSLEVNIGVYGVVRDGREYCKIIVEDNGPGIPDTLKATLFDRLNLANTRVRGKGFGLCLIKMLVDDYDGIFYVVNRVQGDYTKGSRFVVMIPSAEYNQQAPKDL